VGVSRCSRTTWLLFLLIVGLAASLRTLWLGSIPPGLWYDEGLYTYDGYTVAHGNFPVFFDTFGHMREPLYQYSLGAFFAVFGHSTLNARLVSALWGTATVALLFPLARYIVGCRWALVACLSLAVFRWHLHFSRTIFRALLPSFFIVAVVLFFLRWRETRRTRDAACCGAVLGLGMYTYISFRLVPLIVGAGLLWMLWRREITRRDARGIGVMVAGALILFLPLGIDYLKNPQHFSARTDAITMFEKTVMERQADGSTTEIRVRKPLGEAARDIAGNALAIAKMWTIRGDHVARHNYPNAPVFDWANGIVFFVGMGWCLGNLRRSIFPALLLVWLFVISLASVFSFGAPNILRMQGATPAVVLIYVLGLRWMYTCLPSRVPAKLAAALVGTLLLGFAGNQLYIYFVKFSQSLQVRREFLADTFFAPADGARRAATDFSRVRVPQEMYQTPTFRFVLAGLNNVGPYTPDQSLVDLRTSGSIALLTTLRSEQLAADKGRDLRREIRTAGGRLLQNFPVPVEDANGRRFHQPWAELWAIGRVGTDRAE